MPLPRRPRAGKIFGKSLKDFKGPPQLFSHLLMELKQWMSTEDLFAAENQTEKVLLMRQAWDMGKDPLVIMRSSPHALAGALKLWLECLPEPLIRPDLSRILVQAICCLDSEADRMHVMQQVLIHVDSRELQVLYPLLEFLHHHRLNAADTHALADAFAPLLMRLECDSALKDQEYLLQAYGLLTDILIQRYRTLISGIVTAPRTELTPEVASLPAQQKPASQRGAFGGRDAVARMFGRADAPDLPPISEALSRSDSLSRDSDIPVSPGANVNTSTVQPAAHEEAESADDAQRLHEVASDVDNLLAESLDSMLFGEDDTVLHEAFILPTQLSTEVSMDAASESSDSLVSMHSDDSCASKSGACCYEHLERNSPTSLLPEHPFSAPVLLDESACRNHPYLHASMWMAPLPHQGSDHHMTIKGKSGAPLAGCHHDVNSHAGSRGHHPLMPSLGSWSHISVPMHT